MKRTIAIGDVHGCANTLRVMLFDELKIEQEDEIYFVGDYIDRGADSKGVIDSILSLKENGFHIHTLRGNHEQMMMQSTESLENFQLWFRNGGNETLDNFRCDSYSDFPKVYKDFFEKTDFYLETVSYIFVHAGINFSRENIFEDLHTMLWARDFKVPKVIPRDKILIHGHTPRSLKFILSQQSNCINIDGGCVYKDQKKYGNLVALDLTNMKYSVVRCVDQSEKK